MFLLAYAAAFEQTGPDDGNHDDSGISRIDYFNGVLAGAYDVHLRQLQAVLNAAARLIVRKRTYDSMSSTIRDILHWLPIRQRVEGCRLRNDLYCVEWDVKL